MRCDAVRCGAIDATNVRLPHSRVSTHAPIDEGVTYTITIQSKMYENMSRLDGRCKPLSAIVSKFGVKRMNKGKRGGKAYIRETKMGLKVRLPSLSAGRCASGSAERAVVHRTRVRRAGGTRAFY
jgi:hypothetical protein